MRLWRLAALVLGGVLLCLAALGAFVAWNRRDLVWLAAPPPPAVRPAPRVPAPPPEPAPVPVPAPAPVPPPKPRVLSLDGLTVQPYDGELRLDPNVMKVTGVMDQSLVGAVKDLKDAAGLFPTADDKITFVLVSQKDAAFRQAFQASAVPGGARVELALEPMVLGWWAPRQVLAAGLAAGILVQEVPSFAQGPTWMRYGMALYLSGFGDLYARRAFVNSDLPPLQLVHPLDEAGDDAWVDGWLALRAFTATKGDASVDSWVSAMHAGESWDRALARTSGENAQAFDSRYQTWSNAYLAGLSANRQALLDAVALLRRQQEQEALPLLEHFVKEYPLDLYAGNARYFLNYARYRLGRYDRAIDGFTDLLTNFAATTCFQGKAHYFLGRCYELSGYGPLAEQQFQIAELDARNALLLKLCKRRLAEIRENP